MLGDVGTCRLRVPQAVYDGMIDHAAEVMPLEAVGLLAGVDGKVCQRIALPNVLGLKRFLVDPYAQFQALRQLSSAGLEPLAVYHSHPGGGVQLSAEDISFATHLPYLQLVIAIGRTHNPAVEIAAYAVAASTIEKVAVEILAA